VMKGQNDVLGLHHLHHLYHLHHQPKYPWAMSGTPQIIFAFDFGTRRIGVASGDTLTRTAHGVATFDCSPQIPWVRIGKLVSEYRPAQLVVGVPYNMDGTPTLLTDSAREFARELRDRFRLPACLMDERLSSREAEAELREARASGLKRRRLTHGDVDMTAAKIVLERWFSNPTAAEALRADPTESNDMTRGT
jgi:putative holliday junction resolvase